MKDFDLSKFLYALAGILLGFGLSIIFVFLVIFIWLDVLGMEQISGGNIKFVAIIFGGFSIAITKTLVNFMLSKA